MKYLPAENITFKTKLKRNEVLKQLLENVEPEKTFRFALFNRDSTKPYEGYITRQSFEIKRIIGYRNSFLPRISGILEEDFDGTRIKVKMRLHALVIVFLCIWCGFLGIAFIAMLSQEFSSPGFNSLVLMPLGMIIFAYALTMGGFKFESISSKKDLQSIFEAEVIEE